MVADKLKRQWFGGVYFGIETNCIRQLERKLAQIFSEGWLRFSQKAGSDFLRRLAQIFSEGWLRFSLKAGSDFLRRLTTTNPDILTTK